MRQLLTDVIIRNLEPPAAGRLEVADLRAPGLAFRVTSKGVRSWSFRCHSPSTGKVIPRKTLGPYPDVSLAEARSRAAFLRQQVLAGVPVETARRARAAAASKTFGHLAERYLTEHSRRRKKSARLDEGNLRRHVLPFWAERRYDGIGRADVIEVLERLVVAGLPVQANRVQGLLSGVFSFAIDAGLLEFNPCARLRRRGVERVGTRVLSDSELRLFWPGIVEVSRRAGLALRLQLLTGARPGEVAGIALAELAHLDEPGQAWWLLPAARAKNGRAHLVPLTEAARAIVMEAMGLHTAATGYLFPASRGEDKPIAAAAMAVAMQAFAKTLAQGAGDPAAAATWIAAPPTPHDLRRTAGTRLSQLGVEYETRLTLLNHTIGGALKRHYDLHDREAEKRQALERWAAALGRVLEPREGGSVVVPLRV